MLTVYNFAYDFNSSLEFSSFSVILTHRQSYYHAYDFNSSFEFSSLFVTFKLSFELLPCL